MDNKEQSRPPTSEWVMTEDKFLQPKEIERLTRLLKSEARSGGIRSKIRWMCIDLLLQTGLRCAEARNLMLCDLKITGEQASIFVYNGKGGKSANVIISKKLAKHLRSYVRYRDIKNGNVLLSERGEPFSQRGLQMLVKRCFSDAGLPTHYSIHSLRHTYCCQLYRATQDIRLVQKQARHSNIQTTMIYADVLSEDIYKAVNKVFS